MTRSGTRREARRAAGATEPPPPLPEVYRRRRRLGAGLTGLLLLVGLGLTARVLLYDVGLADAEQVRLTVTTDTGAPVATDPAAPGDVPALVPEPQLRATAAVPLGGPLIAVDTAAIADRVRALPAVAAVEVERDWPHTVSVHVVQRTPLAAVQTAHGPAMVDATATVFGGPAVPGLPGMVVANPGPADPATLAGVAVLGALPVPVRGQLLTVTASVDRAGVLGQVVLGLTEGREVRWGTPERSADKAAVLVPLLGQPGHLYDVTSPDLPTIRR